MSTKTKAGKPGKAGKSTAVKSEPSFAPEPLPPVTPVPVGNDPATLIFPEWSDQNVNGEKWDMPKAKDKGKASPKKGTSLPESSDYEAPSQFVDPHFVQLPHSLKVKEWKRPTEFFKGTKLVMYKEIPEYPDLISGSKHLLHSDFMRSFISAIGILEYLGNTRPSPIEFASPTFVPNTSERPWRPWYHIYSMCKAGKGQKHIPQVNQLGKYVVRLFWMGCWRKVTIDDRLPIDFTNHVLLPSLDKPETPENANPKAIKPILGTTKEKEIEMWPFLLCKALLKIANLTQTESNEILDFDIIHCLTGWFVQKMEVTGMDILDIWEMCAGYSDHFTWPDPSQKQGAGAKKGSSKTSDTKSSKSSKGSKGTKGSKSSGKKATTFSDDLLMPYHLVATCSDMRTLAENQLPDIAPCWSHSFLIDQTRDIPLIKPDPLPELARWKRFRWLAWAIRNGTWPEPELVPIKCFKMVSVFKGCAEHVVYKPPSKEAIDIQKSVAVIEDLALKMGGKKKNKDKGSKDKSPKSSKSSKSSKSTSDKKGKKGQPVTVVPLPPDPSLWIDFNKLGGYISCLYIFFKSSRFRTNIKITDITQKVGDAKAKVDKGKKGKGADGKDEKLPPQLLIRETSLALSRNEPVYLFTESIDYKLIVINFAQVGNTDILLEVENESDSDCRVEIQKKTIINSLDMISKSNEYFRTSGEFSINFAQEFECTCPKVPYAYVIVENYNWQTNQMGEALAFLNTYGTKTILIDVKPGRFVLRMWIKTDTSYVVNLMSDSPVYAGNLEIILEKMCQESEILMKLCHDISSTYGQLVQKFGTPQFTEGLTTFCKSYSPDCKLPKKQLVTIHRCFMQELINIIKDNCLHQELRSRIFSLKAMFMNPNLKYEDPDEQKSYFQNVVKKESICDNESQNSEEVIKKTERAAVVLQAYFKKLYVRKLKSLHNESHKNYLNIFDTLRKIYTDYFGVQTRMLMCSTLLRNLLLLNSDMSKIKYSYSILNDLISTIHLQHFTGNVYVPANSWSPIARYVFYCNSPDYVITKICLFCALSKFMLRVFDNDTCQEIKRFTNNTVVYPYTNNVAGYTVLCYGWSETECTFQWKLDFITARAKFASLIIVPPVTLRSNVLQQHYRPNFNNNICRCIISISNDVFVTLRLSTSYQNVKIYFRCVNEVGQVFGEISGTANVILPLILLKFITVTEDTSENISSSQKSISSKDKRSSRSKSRSVSLARTLTNSSGKKKSKATDRTSADRHSSRASGSKRSQSSSGSIKFKDTVYILEGFVIDDSWPLTLDEWEIVEEVKNKLLLGPATVDHAATSSLTDSIKVKETLSSKKSVPSIRRSVGEKSRSSEISQQEPFWHMETVSNLEDSVTTTVDKRREEEIKCIKREWYENDPERYEKSKQLRKEYLESHYIKLPELSDSMKTEGSTSQNYNTSISRSASLPENQQMLDTSNTIPPLLQLKDEEVHEDATENLQTITEPHSVSETSVNRNLRTLHKPISETKMLPPFDLESYMRPKMQQRASIASETLGEEKEDALEYEEEDKYVRTPDDEELLILLSTEKIEKFELEQVRFEEDMKNFLNAQAEQYKLLDNYYKGCRAESRELMRQAYELREEVINKIIDDAGMKPLEAVAATKKIKVK